MGEDLDTMTEDVPIMMTGGTIGNMIVSMNVKMIVIRSGISLKSLTLDQMVCH
jgi:hypothetical protein